MRPFSALELAQVVARAATIDERFASAHFEATPENIIDERLEMWKRSSAGGDDEKWRTRLSLDGWNESDARRAAQNLRVDESAPLPLWAQTLAEIFSSTKPVSRPASSTKRAPFEEAFAPFLEFAARVPLLESLPPSARADLLNALATQLSTLAAPTFSLEFSIAQSLQNAPRDETSNRFYLRFVDELLSGGWTKIALEYPVLARQLSSFCLDWRSSTNEMLERLHVDRAELEVRFGVPRDATITRARANLSDPHRGGRSVSIVEFCGAKLVYKPKNVGAENAFFDFLSELNERGAPLSFAFPRALGKSNYGWVEHIEHAPILRSEIPFFYRRAGALLCVLHWLDATDFHCDNLIARGAWPVPIDAEALFSPRLPFPDGAGFRAAQRLDESVLRTGMLPQFEAGPDVRGSYDISGLGGAGKLGPRGALVRRLNWENLGTDAQQLSETWAPPPLAANAPWSEEFEVEPGDYAPEIERGFRETHAFLCASRAEISASLERFSSFPVRWIFRATGVYGALLERARRPHHLRDGWNHGAALDALSRTFLNAESLHLWPLHARELADLGRGDIPLFETAPQEHREIAQSRFANCEMQCEIIREVFRARQAGKSFVDESPRVACEPFVDESAHKRRVQAVDFEVFAKRIAREFASRAIWDGDEAAWISVGFSPRTLRFQLQPTGVGLYEGGAGIALFLARMGKRFVDEEWCELARAAMRADLNQVQQRPTGLGLSEGNGGIVWALAHLGAILGEDEWTNRAWDLARSITISDVECDVQLDVLGGVAGAILGVLALPGAAQDSQLSAILERCGARLVQTQIETEHGIAWPTLDGKTLCGLSHGTAGIGLALARLGAATRQPKWLELARRAFDWERAHFDLDARDWPDKRFDDCRFTVSWCHGAPGIALSRLAALKCVVDETARREWESDLEWALDATRRAPLSFIDHICCGNLGRASVLARSPAFVDEARALTATVCARFDDFALLPNVSPGAWVAGLWNGAAGVGMHLLQMTQAELPAVWDFSAPQ